MAIDALREFVGTWELQVDLPGADDVRGHVEFERLGELLVQRTTVPVPEAPDSECVVVSREDGRLVQHYFDSRGVARLYEMTYDGDTWTLERTKPDITPLEFCQRFVGRFADDRRSISGEWQSSADGSVWSRDFGLTYRRLST
jgi:hypothetical protein